MALKLSVDALDAIPEAQRDLYEEGEDGKYRLMVDGMREADAVENALQQTRKERDTAAKRARVLERELTELSARVESLGDLDAVKEMLAEREQQKEREAHEKGEVEELYKSKIAALEKRFAKEREELVARADQLKAVLHENVKQARVNAALTKIEAVPEYREFAEMFLAHKSEVRETEGGYDVFVRDGDDYKPLIDWAELWASTEQGQRIVKGPQMSGSGAANESGANGVVNPWKTGDKIAQHRLANENPDRARQMMAAAGRK